MDRSPVTSETSSPAHPPIRLGRTLRLAAREAWDSLGLTCLASFTLFVCTAFPFLTLLASSGALNPGTASAGRWIASLSIAVIAFSPLFAGACWMANVVLERDDPSYPDLWRGARKLLLRALALGAIQALVTLVLLSNLAFYLMQPSFAFLMLAVLFLYALAFWAAQAIYHFPLLVASEKGLLRREAEGSTPITTLLRNALVMAVASPGYSFGIALLLLVLGAASLASGAGIALVFPGYAAFVCMHATRDQLVKFGHIEPPADTEAPIPDERWRVRSDIETGEGVAASQSSEPYSKT